MEQNLVDKGARAAIGGALRPADPRRFLVEAMVCAMNADGDVDPREIAVLERHLAEHELFRGVSPDVGKTMIALARDSLAFAGGPRARIPAIVRGLPSRIHRLAAYAMACEVVRADGAVAASEVAFLDLLRQQLRVSVAEAAEMVTALAQGRLGQHIDVKIEWIRGLLPVAAEMFALRAHTRRTVNEIHRVRVRDHFLALPDLGAAPVEIDGQLKAAFNKPYPPAFHPHRELRHLAEALLDPVDRWWLVVYALAADPADCEDWRQVFFACALQDAFGLGERDMDRAAAEAQILSGAPKLRAAPFLPDAGEQDLRT